MIFKQLKALRWPELFTPRGSKDYTGVPTVLASAPVTAIVFLGYGFFNAYIQWFAILNFASAIAMISDLRVKKIQR